MNKSKTIVGLWTAALFIFLLAVGETQCAERRDVSLDSVTLQLKWTHQFQFAGYYAALEKGYYRDAGLDVTIVPARPGLEPMSEVLDGRAEFGVGTTDVVLLRAQAEPVVVLAVIFQHSPLVLLVRKDAGISSIHDLKGKRVMMEPHSAELLAYLESENLPTSQLTFVPHSFDTKDLINGKVDAMSAYSTDEPFDLLRAGIDFMKFSPRSGGIDFYGDCLFTTDSQVRNHPERVKAFLRASLRGWEYALENPQEIVDLILARFPTKKSREHLLFEASQMQRLINPEIIEIGYMNPGRWKHIADTYSQLGMLDPDFSLNGLLYASKLDSKRFHWIIAALLALAVILSAICVRIYRLNRRWLHQIEERKKAEETLRQTTNTLQAILDTTSSVIFVQDLEGRYTLINREFEKSINRPAEEILGRTDHDLFPEHIADTLRDNELRALSSKAAIQVEEVVEFPSGTEYSLSNLAPLFGPDGEPVGLCGVTTVITERKKSEESLRETKNTLQAILDNTPAFIFVKDLEGRYTLINREFARGFNLPAEEILGKTDHDLFPKHIADILRATDLDVIASKKAIQVEEPGEFPHGMEYGLSNKVPLYDPNGDPIALCGVTTVITERKQAVAALQESEQRLAQIIDFLPDATFVIDKEGTVVAWNRAIEEMTGIRREQMLGKGDYEYAIPFYGERRPILIDLVNERDEATEAKYISVTDRGETLVSESFHPFLSPEGVYLSGTARRLYDSEGQPSGAIESIRDVTDRKNSEEALRLAKETAESATRAKADFLANMSHEIRTPMNAIMGMTDLALLLDVSPRLLDYLTKIRSSSQSLLRIINDILDYSRIEAGRLEPESVPFDILQVVTNTSDVVCASEACRDIEFLVAIGPDVPRGLVGDPFRVEQVLTNLAGNAVKFTPAGGEVMIQVDLVEATQQEVILQLSVRDTGIGISKEKLGTLFNPFTQADGSTTRRFGGSGLGLTICSSLVELMGGQIGVETEPGKGSLFSFELTFQVQPEDRERLIAIPEEISGTRILVVDDNTTSQEILLGILRSFQLPADAVGSGEEALEELVAARQTHPYDLVLLDWKMPGIDGIETARRIDRHSQLSGRIPKIIMMAAIGTEEVRRQAEETCVDALISKPVQPSFLLDTIMEVFGVQGPRVSRSVQTSIREAMRSARFRGTCILVVEDNPVNQQVAKGILEYAGAEVQLALNGREAVTAANESEFDAILMDIQMPEMDGYETTRLLRSVDRFRDLPIIAMTAHAMAGDSEKSLKAGMNDHVTKPIDPRCLLETVAKWVHLPSGNLSDAGTCGELSDGGRALDMPGSLPGIDLDSALRRVGGKENVLKELLVQFAPNHQHAAKELRIALGSKNKEKAQQIAHTVKGVSANISAHRLHMAAGNLETAIGQGNPDDGATEVTEFETALEEVLQSIASLEVMPDDNSAPLAERPMDMNSPTQDLEAVTPILMELASLLAQGSVRSIPLLDTIDMKLGDSPAGKEWIQTCQHARSYNFIGALSALKEMALRLGIQLG